MADAEALRAAAMAHFKAGRLAESRAALLALLQARPNDAAAANSLGVIALQQGQPQEALPWFDRSLAAQPNQAKVLANRVLCHLALDAPEPALRDAEAALALDPTRTDLLADSAALLLRLGRKDAALARYEQALQREPRNLAAASGRASVLLALGRAAEAVAAWDAVLATHGETAVLRQNRANALAEAGRREEAVADWDRALALDPALPLLAGHAWYTQRQRCDWRQDAERSAAIRAALKRGQAAITPFAALSLTGSAAEQLQAQRLDAALTPAQKPLANPRGYGHRKLRIAYVSADFRDHPLGRLMLGVLRGHDRGAFQVIGLATDAKPATDALRPQLAAACDQFIEAAALSDAALAQWLRQSEVDIAIDLTGATKLGRPGLFARRPAPVQVTYLGYPGGSGAPFMDYLVADAVVVPPAQRAHYAETLILLPDCFQANEPAGPLPRPTPRAQLGLPGQGFVFCCLNASHKLGPEDFALWLDLLRQVPGSVLWLLGGAAEPRLRAEAAAAGLAPDRLRFAGWASHAEHLQRLAAADLALDTRPFNGGASTSDALRAGLPVLTWPGEAYAARMSASLLTCLGLEELIAPDAAAFRATALVLARDAARLAALRARLAAARATAPLFDTARFTRHLEAGYIAAVRRAAAGERPADLAVDRLP